MRRPTSWWLTTVTRLGRLVAAAGLLAAGTGLNGCAALHPLRGVPVQELALDEMIESRSDKATIDLSLLTQSKPDQYRVGPEDVLSIYVPGVLGTLIDRDDEVGETPPINIPQQGDAPPTVGFPLTVRGDGTLSLPQVDPINVEGMTLREVEKAIVRAYTVDQEILSSKRPRVIVSLQRPRTYEVLVVRQEKQDEVTGANAGNGQVNVGRSRKGTARLVRLPAYQNDVLHALTQEGVDGLPGLDAENTIYVIRRRGSTGLGQSLPCGCPSGACGCEAGGDLVLPTESFGSPAPEMLPTPAAESDEPAANDAGRRESQLPPMPGRFGDGSPSMPTLPSLSAVPMPTAGLLAGDLPSGDRSMSLAARPAFEAIPAPGLVVPPELPAEARSASLPAVSMPTQSLPLIPRQPAASAIRPTSYERPAQPLRSPRPQRPAQAMQIIPQVRGQDARVLSFDSNDANVRQAVVPAGYSRPSLLQRLTPWKKEQPPAIAAVPNAMTGPVDSPVDANGQLRPLVTASTTRTVPTAAEIQQVGHSQLPEAVKTFYAHKRAERRGKPVPAGPPVALSGPPIGANMAGVPWGALGIDLTVENPSVTKIPVRLSPGEMPEIRERDVILQDGDIVFIESRSTEVFYTGGLLGGGQYELPRDYDLRLLEAISIAQSPQNVVAGRSPGGSTALNGDVTSSGSRVIVMRNVPGGSRLPVEISVYEALRNPQEHNIIIQPGDYIIVQYTALEAWTAFIQQNLLEGALFTSAFTAFQND